MRNRFERMDAEPASIILVKGDSKGDRLLFRYPYVANSRAESSQKHRRNNPYALNTDEQNNESQTDLSSCSPNLKGFTDQVLSNLFAVKQELAEAKFELKANDVRFVGHPTSLFPCPKINKENNRSSVLINVVFALKASASHSIVKCYYELSKRLGVALRHEEKRCGYVTTEMKTMISVHDDFGAREESQPEDGISPFEEILEKSSLARDLRRVYDDVKSTGLVHLRINRWIELSFCLPQKVHQLNNRGLIVEPETIDKCLQSIRPYHGLLLLYDASHLLDSLVPDASPALVRLIKIYSPLKSLQTLSADADLTLAQVFNLAGHLVYWGKATIIYPLCESNIYMTAPSAPVHVNSPLVEKFAEQFPNHSLIQVMSEFSLPVSIRQKLSSSVVTSCGLEQEIEVQIIVWLLQHRLLVQIHTYIYYMPTSGGLSLRDRCQSRGDGGEVSYEESTINGGSDCDETNSSNTSCDEEISWSYNGMNVSDMPQVQTEVWGGVAPIVGEDCLAELSHDQRRPLIDITPPGASPDDLKLLVRLIVQGYLRGEHHLEEIMYTENVRRSQLLQLIDKFREVLITCETEDPAIAMFYPHSY